MDDVIEVSRALHLSGDDSDAESDTALELATSNISLAVKRKNEDSEPRDLSQLSKRKALITEPSHSPQNTTPDLPQASNSHVDSSKSYASFSNLEATALDGHLESSHELGAQSISPSSSHPALSTNVHSSTRSSDEFPCSLGSSLEPPQAEPSSPSSKLSDKVSSQTPLPLPLKPSIAPDTSLAVDVGLSTHDSPNDADGDIDSDPTYVRFRMYCSVKGASLVVGKKGETIRHLRENSNARIDVSDNLQGVPERIISVRGPAENVARAFGLLVRVILNEPENEPALASSKQYNLKLLVPHTIVGFIIGKQGVKFREIEEKSAAKLKAADQPLPYLTERILSIVGVADAIHIATYYVAMVIREHKETIKKTKVVFYKTQSYSPANVSHAMMNIIGNVVPINHGQAMFSNHRVYPIQTAQMHGVMNSSSDQPMPYIQMRYDQHNDAVGYDMAPAYGPASIGPTSHNRPVMSNPQPRTDEFNNTFVGDVVVKTPIPIAPSSDRYDQEIFVPDAHIGSVIGKRGNNIKHVREHSGCTFVKIEAQNRESLMLGGGKGMTPVRKLTLTGTASSLQTAIYLINQRIQTDRERNAT